MGYDLRANKEGMDGFHMGAFSFPWMLDQGVGWPIKCGKGIVPGSYVATTDPDNCPGDPHTNDGFKVTAEQARQMAMIARLLADYQDLLFRCWEQMPEEERKRIEESTSSSNIRYNLPVRRDFVERVRKFADWAEASEGFEIH